MTLLLLLMMGHMLGDYVFQPLPLNALLGHGERMEIAPGDRWPGALERVGSVALTLAGLVYLAPLAFVPRVLLQRGEWLRSPRRVLFLAKTGVSFCSGILTAFLLAQLPVSLF